MIRPILLSCVVFFTGRGPARALAVASVDQGTEHGTDPTEDDSVDQETSERDRRASRFHVVDVRCPAEKGQGVLEVFKRNQLGERYHARFTLANDALIHLRIDTARPGRRPVPSYEIDAKTARGSFERDLLKKTRTAIDYYHAFICFGLPEIRDRYLKSVAKTKARLGRTGRI